jgi:hypothetical protein
MAGGQSAMVVSALFLRMSDNHSHVEFVVFTGGGPLGHPKIFINLVRIPLPFVLQRSLSHVGAQDKPGARPCGYA